MLEPAYSSVEVMTLLHEDGIQAARERVNMMTDDLFGRTPGLRTRRRISHQQMCVIREAFRLTDQEGLPRDLVIAMHRDPDRALADMHAALQQSKTALAKAEAHARDGFRQFCDSDNDEARTAAARLIREAFCTIERARRLVAA